MMREVMPGHQTSRRDSPESGAPVDMQMPDTPDMCVKMQISAMPGLDKQMVREVMYDIQQAERRLAEPAAEQVDCKPGTSQVSNIWSAEPPQGQRACCCFLASAAVHMTARLLSHIPDGLTEQ